MAKNYLNIVHAFSYPDWLIRLSKEKDNPSLAFGETEWSLFPTLQEPLACYSFIKPNPIHLEELLWFTADIVNTGLRLSFILLSLI